VSVLLPIPVWWTYSLNALVLVPSLNLLYHNVLVLSINLLYYNATVASGNLARLAAAASVKEWKIV